MSGSPKEDIHDVLQASLGHDTIAPELAGGAVTRWVTVCECVLPDRRVGLAIISSTAGNTDMTGWDETGFLVTGAIRSATRQR